MLMRPLRRHVLRRLTREPRIEASQLEADGVVGFVATCTEQVHDQVVAAVQSSATLARRHRAAYSPILTKSGHECTDPVGGRLPIGASVQVKYYQQCAGARTRTWSFTVRLSQWLMTVLHKVD